MIRREDIKLIATDIDGVWTDGGMYYDNSTIEIKKFNTYDSAGVFFAKKMNIPVAIVTGENVHSVSRRAEKLKIDYVYLGVQNKMECLNRLCEQLQINLENVAYLGDDLNDIEVLTNVGFSGCPYSAPLYIKEIVNKVYQKKGGEGVFREFVEDILGIDSIEKVRQLLGGHFSQ